MPEELEKGSQKESETDETKQTDQQSQSQQEGESSTQIVPTPTAEEGVQTPFTHGTLVGKTPEEIQTYVQVMEASVRESSDTVTRMTGEVNRLASDPVRDEPAASELSADDFWKDPVNSVGSIVSEHLKKVIVPFEKDLAASRVSGAWTEAASSLPNFAIYKPLIESQLAKQGITNPTIENLTAMYYMSAGMVATVPGAAEKLGMKTDDKSDTSRVVDLNPQHSSSSHPLANPGTQKTELRDLTENEERLRREWKMTKEEYLKGQEVDMAADPMVMSTTRSDDS